MEPRIEAPNDEDITRVAGMLINANQLAQEIISEQLDQSLEDLKRLQRIIDTRAIQPDATYQLQSLGLAFGKVFVAHNEDYDWWMYEDEYGRDPCLRYRETSLLAFPQTMLSKRIEDAEAFTVPDLYSWLVDQHEEIRIEHYKDD